MLSPEKDPFGEWLNPESFKRIARLVEGLGDFNASMGKLRGHRPGNRNEGVEFWSAPIHKAHWVNLLLSRGDTSINKIEETLNINKGKASMYNEAFGFRFSWRPRVSAKAITYEGERVNVEIIKWLEGRDALLNVVYTSAQTRGTWSPASAMFRLHEPDVPSNQGVIPVAEAAYLAGVSLKTMGKATYALGLHGNGFVHLEGLEQLFNIDAADYSYEDFDPGTEPVRLAALERQLRFCANPHLQRWSAQGMTSPFDAWKAAALEDENGLTARGREAASHLEDLSRTLDTWLEPKGKYSLPKYVSKLRLFDDTHLFYLAAAGFEVGGAWEEYGLADDNGLTSKGKQVWASVRGYAAAIGAQL